MVAKGVRKGNGKRRWKISMNLKLRLKFSDIFKLLFGGDVMVLDKYNNHIYRIQKGNDTYICKG